MGFWTVFAIVLSAASFTASYVQAKKAQKKAKRLADEMAGVLVNKESNIEAIPVVYGERRVGGVRVFMSTSGDSRHEYLYVALVVSEGAVESISDLEIDEVPATDSRFQGLLSYHYKLGTDDQTTSTVLDDALITEDQIFDDAERDYQGVIVTNQDFVDDFRLRGVAYVAMRLKYDSEVFGGVPDFTVKVKGRKVYDPRQDSTSSYYDSTVGVSTQRASDSSTWEWSDNPAVCLRDYLTNERFGKGLSSSDLDEAQFVQAADDLDSFTVTPYPSSSTTIKLFTLNAVIDTNEEIFTNVEKILLSCRGYLPYTFGKYGLKIDQAATSVMTLDTSNIVGDINIVGSRKEDRFNQVIVKFPDANTRFQPNNAVWPNPSSSNNTLVSDGSGGYLTESELHDEFLADDDEFLVDEIDLEYCTNFYQARDLARIFLWRSRNAINVAFQATSEAMELTVGDVVSVTHPTPNWTAKKFQVDEMGINYDGTVTLKCVEYDSTIYTYDPSAEEIEAIDIIRGDTSAILGPTSVAGTNTGSTILDDGTFHAVLNVSWTAADDATVIEYEVRYKLDTDSEYKYLKTTDTSVRIEGMTPGLYNIGVRSINYVGEKSDFVDGSNVDTGVDTGIPGVITNLSFTSGVRSITVEWTNPTDADYAFTEIHAKTTNVTPQNTDTPTAKVAGEEYVYPTAAGVVSRYFFLRSVDRTGNKSAFTGTSNNLGSSLQATGDDIEPGEIQGKTLALLLNKTAEGNAATGEGALVGVNLDGTPNLGSDGSIIYNGSEITIEHNQYASGGGDLTIATQLANKRGYIVFDINKTKPFQMSGALGNWNCAFVHLDSGTFYYDNNSATRVSFDPNSFTGTQTGTDSTTTAHIVSLGVLETSTADNILAGGLYGEPRDLVTEEIPTGAVDITQFASGIQPVQVVSSLPGSAIEGEMAFLTTDKKLYRYNGTQWTVAVDGADVSDGTLPADAIVANSLTAGQIAAGAISTDELAADAVTAQKILANTISFDKLLGGVNENVTSTLASSVSISPSDSLVTIDSVQLPAPDDTTVGHKPIVIVKMEWNIIGSSNWDDDGGDLPEVNFFVSDQASGYLGQIATYYYTHHSLNDTSASYAKHSAEMIGFFDTAITAAKYFYVKGSVTSFDGQVSQDRITVTKCDIIVVGIR